MGDHRFNAQSTELERRLAAGQLVQVKDRLGRDLAVGDLVSMPLAPERAASLLWQVKAITRIPAVDPRQPQEMMRVDLTAAFHLVGPNNRQAVNELLRVAEGREVGVPAPLAGVDTTPDDAAPPPTPPDAPTEA